MTEKESINVAVNNTDKENSPVEEIDKIKTLWGKLFSSFSTIALEQGVETTELEFDGSIDNDYFIKFHAPFSNDRMQPMVINVDIYDDNNEHVQRASGLAIWNENEPEVISVNNHQMETREMWFDVAELARRAVNIMQLSEAVQVDKSTGLPKNACFPIPEKYLDSIH